MSGESKNGAEGGKQLGQGPDWVTRKDYDEMVEKVKKLTAVVKEQEEKIQSLEIKLEKKKGLCALETAKWIRGKPVFKLLTDDDIKTEPEDEEDDDDDDEFNF